MVRVLLQLKVNRLCLVVDGTVGFDPFQTFNTARGSSIAMPVFGQRSVTRREVDRSEGRT